MGIGFGQLGNGLSGIRVSGLGSYVMGFLYGLLTWAGEIGPRWLVELIILEFIFYYYVYLCLIFISYYTIYLLWNV